MDQQLIEEAIRYGIATSGKTEEQVREAIKKAQAKEVNPNAATAAVDPLTAALQERYFDYLDRVDAAMPETAEERRERRDANPKFFDYEEGKISQADRKRLENNASEAGMSVEDYSALSGLDKFEADQVGAQERAAQREQTRKNYEIDPYDKELVDGLSEPLNSPFEMKRSMREANDKKRAEMEAAGKSPDEIRAALTSETEMSDAAQQRWKDLTATYKRNEEGKMVPNGTVEDRRAYWTAAADRMKAEGRSVGTVTRMETPDGEVIAERDQNNGSLRWADGSVGGPADMSNPAFARSSEEAQRADTRPTKATVPVVYAGAGNNDPVIDPYSGQQEMALAPRPTTVESENGGRAVSGIYGSGRTTGATFTPEQEAELTAAQTPDGFMQTARGPVATKRDPLVDVQEEEKKKKERAIAEGLSRRQQPGGRA